MSVVIRAGAPGDAESAIAVENAVWAPFHYEADGAPDWEYDTRFWVVAEADDATVVATADGCLVEWDGDPRHLPPSWTEVINRSRSVPASMWVCALGTSIDPSRRTRGLGGKMLEALAGRARDYGARGMLAPARPTARAQFPHLSIVEYAQLRLADGSHVDPWIRVHERLGARIVGTAQTSMKVTAPVGDWERWLSQRLPTHGRLLVPGAIGWLTLADGRGTLTESSIWMLHPTSPELTQLLGGYAPHEHDAAMAALNPSVAQ